MTKLIRLNRRALWISLLATPLVFILLFSAGVDTRAQGQGCGVGTRVELESGTKSIGTIEEIGTESPHVGWYRISFSWSPKGEWFNPKYSGILIAGTKTKCGQATAIGKQETQSNGTKTRPQPNSVNPVLEQAGCPMVEPPGKVMRTSTASAQLFKRVIYEEAAAKINPESITAPKKVGLTFLEFNMGAPYRNTLTSSRFGDKRRHDGAPVGAMIYPVKTKELLCELHGEQIRRWVEEASRNCFKNREGDWVCPGRTTKVVENRLIPVK